MRDQGRLPLRKKLDPWMNRSRNSKLSHRLLAPSFKAVNPYICGVVLRHRDITFICVLSSLWHLMLLVYDIQRLPVVKEPSTSNFIMLALGSPLRLSLLVYTTHTTHTHTRTPTYEAHGTVANVISSVNPPHPSAVLKVENRTGMPVRGLKPSSPYSYLSSSSTVLPVRVGYIACQTSAFQVSMTKTLYLR